MLYSRSTLPRPNMCIPVPPMKIPYCLDSVSIANGDINPSISRPISCELPMINSSAHLTNAL